MSVDVAAISGNTKEKEFPTVQDKKKILETQSRERKKTINNWKF